jgi:signal transduction histidine kinase/ActR/RegA family two-component response regulator
VPSNPPEETVFVIAPVGGDAAAMADMLSTHGIASVICPDPGSCLAKLDHHASAMLITEDVLELPSFSQLLDCLKRQPPWSELPLIILTSGGESRVTSLLALTAAAAGSVTLLERPMCPATLLRSVQVALRSRRRQLQVRDLLAAHNHAEADLRRQALELEQLNRTLDQRVRNRTAQLHELTRELAQSEHRERTRLAHMLHDGLQQILVAARMHADLLVQSPDPPRSGNSRRRLIDLLTEAIVATRSLTLELCPPVLQAHGLGPALEWLGTWMTEKHQLRVSLSVDARAELEDATERLLFFQCARELLFNVVKHSGCRHANLRSWWNAHDQQLYLEVSDEGAGFDPASLGSNCRSFGLNSIRHRLELLGGKLALNAAPGQGTRVLIWVPVKPDDHEPTPAARATELGPTLRPAPEPWPQNKRVRVLLVDDHQIVRDGLGEILQRQPDLHLVGQASDGIEAVDMALHLKPDVILMDFRMPRLDGLEATRRILAALPQTRVIGLSTYEELEKAVAMRHAGAVDYLTKEQPVALLLKAIRRAVGATTAAPG